MRSRLYESLTIEARRSLKPAKGDTVTYGGRRFKVLAAGIRYLRMTPIDGDGRTVYVALIADVVKAGAGYTHSPNFAV